MSTPEQRGSRLLSRGPGGEVILRDPDGGEVVVLSINTVGSMSPVEWSTRLGMPIRIPAGSSLVIRALPGTSHLELHGLAVWGEASE